MEGPENFPEILQGLFRLILTPTDGAVMLVKLDRANCLIRPRSLDPATPQDIVCRIDHYPINDLLSQRALDHCPYDYMGGSINVLPDLSHATLQLTALPYPLLDLLKKCRCCLPMGHSILLPVTPPLHPHLEKKNYIFNRMPESQR